MKIILSIVVAVIWFFLLVANLIGAGKTRDHAMLAGGASVGEAQVKATLIVVVFALIMTVLAAVVLWLIWS